MMIMQLLNVYFQLNKRLNIENSITLESTPGNLLAIIIHIAGWAGLTKTIELIYNKPKTYIKK